MTAHFEHRRGEHSSSRSQNARGSMRRADRAGDMSVGRINAQRWLGALRARQALCRFSLAAMVHRYTEWADWTGWTDE